MKLKSSVFLMSLVYAITQVINILLGILMKGSAFYSQKSFFVFVIVSTFGVGLIGMLVGFIYSKLFDKLPGSNLYMKTSIYLVGINLLLFLIMSLPKGFNQQALINLGISILVAIGGGLLFSWMYTKFSKISGQP
jgi:hypothetical protein